MSGELVMRAAALCALLRLLQVAAAVCSSYRQVLAVTLCYSRQGLDMCCEWQVLVTCCSVVVTRLLIVH